MGRKGTLDARTKTNMLLIAGYFSPFSQNPEKLAHIMKGTGLTKKQALKALEELINRGGIEKPRKGWYKPRHPRLNELRNKLGGGEARVTVDDLIRYLKNPLTPSVCFKEQTGKNPATLELHLLDADEYGITDWKKERDLHQHIERTIQIVRGNSPKPRNLRIRKIIGYISWEEPEGGGLSWSARASSTMLNTNLTQRSSQN